MGFNLGFKGLMKGNFRQASSHNSVLVSVKASLQFYRMNLTPACNFLTWSQIANVSARSDFRCTNNGTVLLLTK